MKAEIDIDNVVQNLKEWFPEFRGYEEDEGLPMAYFNFFTIFLLNHLSDAEVVEKDASFINVLTECGDSSLDSLLDDFFINLYTLSRERQAGIDIFLDQLSSKSKKIYDINVELWLKGNSES